MSQLQPLSAATPFTFLGSIRCIPVSKLSSLDKDMPSSAQTVRLQAGSTRLLPPVPQPESSSDESAPAPATAFDATKNPPSHMRGAKKRTGSVSRFPQKLYSVVTSCESDAIRWSADGTSIIIHYNLFRAEYLQSLFKTANISSFVRQLNLYGFRKAVTSTPGCRSAIPAPEFHIFSHPHFLRDNPELVKHITRSVAAGSRSEKENSEDGAAERNSASDPPNRQRVRRQAPGRDTNQELHTALDFLFHFTSPASRAQLEEQVVVEDVIEPYVVELNPEPNNENGDKGSIQTFLSCPEPTTSSQHSSTSSSVVFLGETQFAAMSATSCRNEDQQGENQDQGSKAVSGCSGDEEAADTDSDDDTYIDVEAVSSGDEDDIADIGISRNYSVICHTRDLTALNANHSCE